MSEDPADHHAPPARLSPWASLGQRDYSFLFLLALFATTAQQMRQAQIFYQVYDLSGSAFQLGMALTSTLNIVLTPTRMSIISYLVPRTHLTNAVLLNSAVSQASHFIGPMLGGLSLAWMSTGNAYLFNALFYLPAVMAIILLKIPPIVGKSAEKFSLASLLGGVKFLISEPVVFAMVILDFVVIGFGYFRPLLPVFAKDILFVGPTGFGMLSSAPAIGGIIATVSLLLFGDVKNKGSLALWSFLAYAAAVGLLALSSVFWLSLLLLGITGLANSLQAVMRQTTFHLRTPDQVRGRAFAVFHMFSQGANGFGATEIGFMAALLGAPGALLFGGAVGGLLTLGCWVGMPGLRRFGNEKQ